MGNMSLLGFSTWGKKMGRKIEQFTRGDSRDPIHFPLGSTRARRKQWRPCKDLDIETDSQDSRQPRKTRVDRVESIRNLFRRSRSWDSAKDLDDTPLKSNEMLRDRSLETIGNYLLQPREKVDNIYESLKETVISDLEHDKTLLFRSASTSHLPIDDPDLTEMIVDEELIGNKNNEGEKTSKKGQFPYAFLRSKLSCVEEEQHMITRDECCDSGRGTGSHCGSMSDLRMSYSENSDSKSGLSENSDSKSSCSETSDSKSVKEENDSHPQKCDALCSIPAPTGFGDNDFVVTVRVDGDIPIERRTSRSKKKETSDEKTICKPENREMLTDEEKLRAKFKENSLCSCGKSSIPPQCSNGTLTLPYIRRRKRSQSQPRLSNRASYPISSLRVDGVYETVFPQEEITRTSLDLNILETKFDKLSHIEEPRIRIDPCVDRVNISKYESLENYRISTRGSRRRYSRSSSLDRTESWRWSSELEENECLHKRQTPSLPRSNPPTSHPQTSHHLTSHPLTSHPPSIHPRSNPTPSIPRSIPNPVSLPRAPLSSKTFKLVRLVKEGSDELGIFISGRKKLGFTIAHIQPGGLTHRDGRLQVGDEIVNVNGTRLRGVTLEQARGVLRDTPPEVDIVVARDPKTKSYEGDQEQLSICSDMTSVCTSVCTSMTSESVATSMTSERLVDSTVDTEDELYTDSLQQQQLGYNTESCSNSGDGILWAACQSCTQPLDNMAIRDLSSNNTQELHQHKTPMYESSRCCHKSATCHAQEDGVVTAVLVRTVSESSSGEDDLTPRRLLPSVVEDVFEERPLSQGSVSSNRIAPSSGHPSCCAPRQISRRHTRNNSTSSMTRRPRSLNISFYSIMFEKGGGQKSLGFSIVGGRDSPKGNLGVFIKTIFPNGQAKDEGTLRPGDEIFAINGESVAGKSHAEAIAMFKKVRSGQIILHVGRRTSNSNRSHKTKSYDSLNSFTE